MEVYGLYLTTLVLVAELEREVAEPGYRRQTRVQIKANLQKLAAITGREVCLWIGLLTARAICPNKEKLYHHWKTTDEGAVPRERFRLYMTRDRFTHISSNLHFNSNSNPRAVVDRAWKLRPVIEALQRQFQAGYVPSAVISFDEAMLPSRSSFNRIRVYMKDKPHKYGTKLFMMCCADNAYCVRRVVGRTIGFEVYRGKRRVEGGAAPRYGKSGPAAVVRNVRSVFGDEPSTSMRLIVTNRYYTSGLLALYLLTLGFYSVGTVMSNRLGLCQEILDNVPKVRPAGIARGTFAVTESTTVEHLRMLRWWDNNPVYMLFSGGSIEMYCAVHREKTVEVPCPRVVKDYHTFMGGVDVHDQLRLERKYYKTLFLGFVDLAIINVFIVYNQVRSAANKTKLLRVGLLKQLHLELCQVNDANWTELRRTLGQNGTSTRQRAGVAGSHMPVQTVDKRKETLNAVAKDVSEHCDTCVLTSIDQKTGETKTSPVYLCNKVKYAFDGQARTCFEIWHKCWGNGATKPSRGKRKIRVRVTERGEEGATGDQETSQRQRPRLDAFTISNQ